jgi:hypothetical protein
VSLDGLPDATMKVNGVTEEQVRTFSVSAEPDQATTLKVFVTLPAGRLEEQAEDFEFVVKDEGGDEQDTYDAVFFGPAARK